MSAYAKQLPLDKGRTPMQEYPAPFKALARYTGENATASSVISVSHDATAIEVAAVGGAAAIRWVPRTETAAVSPFASIITIAGTTSNYDHVVSSGTVRRFVIPKETTNEPVGSVVGINRLEGLYQRVAVKSVGIASVMTTEY